MLSLSSRTQQQHLSSLDKFSMTGFLAQTLSVLDCTWYKQIQLSLPGIEPASVPYPLYLTLHPPNPSYTLSFLYLAHTLWERSGYKTVIAAELG